MQRLARSVWRNEEGLQEWNRVSVFLPCRHLPRHRITEENSIASRLPIDFSQRKSQTDILLRDKVTRVEGLCAEHVFRKLLIHPNFADEEVTHEWWFYRHENGYGAIKLLFNRKLSMMDMRLFDRFKSAGVHVTFLYFAQKSHDFWYTRPKHLQASELKKTWFRKLSTQPISVSVKKDDPRRQEKCIAFLEKRDLLFQSAVQRYAVNVLIKKKALWDIDAFVLHEDKLIAFEVKQKFPSHAGCFGINVGLVDLFTWLESLGIGVYHIILTKPIWQESFSAVEMLENKKYWPHSMWLGCKPTLLQLQKQVQRLAPAKTSIHRQKPLSFYELDVRCLRVLGSLLQAATSLPKLLQGEALPAASLAAIPKIKP